VWESSGQGDLTFSFYWEGKSEPAALGSFAMACSLGVRDFLAVHGIDAQCKWPNDVLVGDAKICGILAEGGCGGGAYELIVGIGVNLRRVPGREERFGRSIAALEDHAPGNLDPAALLPILLGCLEPRIEAWRRGGFAALRDDLLACLWGVGRAVSAKTPRGRIEGVMQGLGDNGEMLLRRADGGDTAVASVSALEGWGQ
jgi:BirA family biotin operon repressor/biotin-[acetyl-CoA-carboxylase] ligase